MSTTYIIIASVSLAVFIAALSLSSYGLGREEGNKMSAEYQTASAFAMISTTGTIISMLILIILIVMRSTSGSRLSIPTSFNAPQKAYF